MERGDTKKQGMQSQWELGAGNVRACSNEFASACNSGGLIREQIRPFMPVIYAANTAR